MTGFIRLGRCFQFRVVRVSLLSVHGPLPARGVRVQSDSTHEKTAIRALNTPVVDVNGRTWWLDNTGLRHDRQPQPY